jgi:hypothetical protein
MSGKVEINLNKSSSSNAGRKPRAPRRRGRTPLKKAAVARRRNQNQNPNQGKQNLPSLRANQNAITSNNKMIVKNEQFAFNSLVKMYLQCLLDPEKTMCRVPDGFAQRTALVRSIETYAIPAVFGQLPSTNNGKFSVLAQPIFGNPARVDQYATYICNPDNAAVPGLYWGTDWTDPRSYVGDDGTNDPRLIAIAPVLTNQRPSVATYLGTAAITGPNPFGTAVPTVQTYNNSTVYTTTATDSIFNLPYGNYMLAWTIQTTAAGVALTLGPGTNVNVLNMASNFYGVAGVGAAVGFALISVPGVVAPGNQFMLRAPAGFTSANATMLITPMYTDQLGAGAVSATQRAGLVSAVRPVAMSMLVTSMVSHLDDGGNITAALISRQAAATGYFSENNTTTGQLQETKAVAQQDRSLDTRSEFGSYSYWIPSSVQDTEFITPDELNDRDYPCLVASGFVKFNVLPTVNTECFRVRVVRVFEIQTATTLLEQKIDYGDDLAIKTVFQLLANAETSVPNGKHWDYIVRLLKTIGNGMMAGAKWGADNKSWILPAMSAVSTLLV